MENKKKVLLGMSGGVDSSVSAILLKEAGYDVIGITLELYGGSCCNISTNLDAKKVCEKIGIPHFTFNYTEEFKKHVVDDFIDCYSNCKTPNPCIECNRYLKFGVMYEKAKQLGCEYIATGHYAKTEFDENYGKIVLKKAKNLAKDQSYVLYNTPSDILPKVLFPLGNFNSKDEIRQIAREHELVVANKPDSEDICFIPDGNYKTFLENNSNLKPKQGNIVDKNGNVLGKHKGLYYYTIGQRKGLGISYKVPLFVTGFNKARNEVIVGEMEDLFKKEMEVCNVNLLLIDKLEKEMKVSVKTRYSSKQANATISPLENGNIKVEFDEPQKSLTPGQSAVFYIDDIVLGGGKIK
ncbi:MAG: tRNA 2-thiouridine(34) synthase MnmA [Clostridia bacterium]